MHPKDLLNRTLVAASVAESEGYTATAKAFRKLAEGLLIEMGSEIQNKIIVEVQQSSKARLSLVR